MSKQIRPAIPINERRRRRAIPLRKARFTERVVESESDGGGCVFILTVIAVGFTFAFALAVWFSLAI